MRLFLKKTLTYSVLLFVFTALPLIIINYTLDPYGLIRSFSNNYKTEPNMRSIKNWYVSENKNKPYHLFFSNSRGGTYTFKDSSYYNMSYSMGVPWQFHEDIKSLLDKGVTIKSVIIMIDEFSIFNNSENHKNQPLRNKYHKNDVFSFITVPLHKEKIGAIFSYRNNKKNIKYNINKDGSLEYNNFNIGKSIDTIQNQIKTVASSLKTKKCFDEVISLINYLNSQNIAVDVGVHPISLTNFKRNKEKYSQLQSLIALLNKSNINLFNKSVIIDDNKLNWVFYDPSHYSPLLAQKVIDELHKHSNNSKIDIISR